MRSSRITEWALNPLTSGFIRDRRQKQKDTRKRRVCASGGGLGAIITCHSSLYVLICVYACNVRGGILRILDLALTSEISCANSFTLL